MNENFRKCCFYMYSVSVRATIISKYFYINCRLKVPPCLESATIIPVQKSRTLIVKMSFVPLLQRQWVHTQCCLTTNLDLLHLESQLLDWWCHLNHTAINAVSSEAKKKKSYARILFLDFRSVFNAILPWQLTENMKQLTASALGSWSFLDHQVAKAGQGGHQNIHPNKYGISSRLSPQPPCLHPAH